MNLRSILIGSEDSQRLIEFYSRLFGKPAMEEGGFAGWEIGNGWLTVGPHDQVKGGNGEPGRIIWNIESPDVKADFERLKEAGANVVKDPYEAGDEEMQMSIATFSDPDNNYFQLVSVMQG